MKKALSVFNAAEWFVVIISSVTVFVAAQGLQSPYRFIVAQMPTAFWLSVMQYRQQKLNNSKPLNGSQTKYPRHKTQEQIRTEHLQRRQYEYDRDLTNRMRAKGMAPAPQTATPSAPKRDISAIEFMRLTRMVNGQQDVARRLIEANLKMFPDKTPDWACDKAIADLERDRRA